MIGPLLHVILCTCLSLGYRYGKSLIPVSSEDEEAMKLQTSKCLSLLGFTSKDKVIDVV